MNYKMIFIAFGALLIIISCKKKETPPPAPKSYISKMGGIRKWAGTLNSIDYYHPINNYTVNITDTFPVITINDSAVAIGHANWAFTYIILHLKLVNDSTKTMFFQEILIGDTTYLSYNYASDNLIYKEYRTNGSFVTRYTDLSTY